MKVDIYEMSDKQLTDYSNSVKELIIDYIADKEHITKEKAQELKESVIVNFSKPSILGRAIETLLKGKKFNVDSCRFFISEIKRIG